MSDVLEYVQSKFPTVKQASANEVNVACPFCGEDPGKRGRLYINVDPSMDPPGLFHCKLCDERGAINKIRKHFGDPILTDDDSDLKRLTPKVQQIIQFAAEYYHELLFEQEEAYDYLRFERGLSPETIKRFKLGWADGSLRGRLLDKGFDLGDCIRSGLLRSKGNDFLWEHITIPYRVNGSIVQVRGKAIGGKYLTPPNSKARLFNSDTTYDADTVLVSEGEFDAMVLEQLGFNAVAAPGAGTWQDEWTGYLDGAKRVYTVFDADEQGVKGAERVQTKLPRARIVKIPEVWNDAEDGKQASLADVSDLVVKHGKSKQDFDFWIVQAKGGMLVTVDEAYQEWLEIEGNPNLAGMKLGYEVVDTMIRPGLLPAQIMITLAKTGVGKTISMLNMFHRMTMEQPEKKILFVSLEQTRNEWFERARRIHRFYNLHGDNQSTLEWYRHRLMLVDKNRVSEEQLCSCIEQFEFDMGQKPDLVAVDYLGYWARSYKGDPYERTSTAVHAMKAIAKEYRVPFYAPHQVSRIAEPGKEPDLNAARDSGVVEETADFVFVLWAPDQKKGMSRDEQSGEIQFKILKSRHGGVGSKMLLQFAPLCLTMIPKNDTLYQRAKNDHDYALRGLDFDEAIERHVLLESQRARAREEF